MTPLEGPEDTAQDRTAAEAGRWALLDYRLGQIERDVGKLANPEAQALQHQYLDGRVKLLEEAQADERKNRRALVGGVTIALVVPVLSYVLQLTQVLPTPAG